MPLCSVLVVARKSDTHATHLATCLQLSAPMFATLHQVVELGLNRPDKPSAERESTDFCSKPRLR